MIKLVNLSNSNTAKNRTSGQVRIASNPQANVIFLISHDDIARRAYEIYARNGCLEGQSEKNWLEAEKELLSQREGRKVACGCKEPSVLKIPRRG